MLKVFEKTTNSTELLGTYCGTTALPTFVSKHILIIMFGSDVTNAGRGFHASYYKLEGIS